jgi:anti-sigma28 factor (negative regulator of flagellin synthesis)
MTINHIVPSTEIQKYTGTKRVSQPEEKRPLGRDGLFISSEAKSIQQREKAIRFATEEVEKVPAVREDLVAKIKEKLANGEYIRLSEEVAGVIADRIVDGLYLGT